MLRVLSLLALLLLASCAVPPAPPSADFHKTLDLQRTVCIGSALFRAAEGWSTVPIGRLPQDVVGAGVPDICARPERYAHNPGIPLMTSVTLFLATNIPAEQWPWP